MKALVLHGPGDYRVHDDWPAPRARPGWARIRVTHSGICGSDLPRFGSTGSYRHPMILGHEFTGVVETPAPGSTAFKVGERVAVLPIVPCGRCEGCTRFGPFHCASYGFLGSRDDGGQAELCAVPETNLLRMPTGADPRVGALAEPLAVGLHVVRRSGFASGDTAIVYGAGAIGLLTATWLREFGAADITIADVRAESLAIARRLGFDALVDPATAAQFPLPHYDHAFEAAGSQAALRDAIERVRPQGTITVVGRDTRDTVMPLASFERMMRKELTIRTCWGYDLRGNADALRSALTPGRLNVGAVITQQVRLHEAPDLVRRMLDRSIFYCKAIIDMETPA